MRLVQINMYLAFGHHVDCLAFMQWHLGPEMLFNVCNQYMLFKVPSLFILPINLNFFHNDKSERMQMHGMSGEPTPSINVYLLKNYQVVSVTPPIKRRRATLALAFH